MRAALVVAIAFVLCASAMAVRSNTLNSEPTAAETNVAQATNAAYRDGVYEGSLAAKRNGLFHVAVGRWATEEDRASFSEGYRQAFGETANASR
jgi:uncharacterized protein with FMN-binding domain